MGEIIIAILVLVVVLAGVGYYIFFMRPKSPNADQGPEGDNNAQDVNMEDADQMMPEGGAQEEGQDSMPAPPSMPEQNAEQGMETQAQEPAQEQSMQTEQPEEPMQPEEQMQPEQSPMEETAENLDNTPPSQS